MYTGQIDWRYFPSVDPPVFALARMQGQVLLPPALSAQWEPLKMEDG